MQAMAIIRFAYSCTEEELAALAMDFADNVKPRTDGLIWKVFVQRPEDRCSAGIYLFRDIASARNYVDGPYVRQLRAAPIVSNVSAELFQIMPEASARAGAPL